MVNICVSFSLLLAHSLKKIMYLLNLSFVFCFSLVVFPVADFVSAASGRGVM